MGHVLHYSFEIITFMEGDPKHTTSWRGRVGTKTFKIFVRFKSLHCLAGLSQKDFREGTRDIGVDNLVPNFDVLLTGEGGGFTKT